MKKRSYRSEIARKSLETYAAGALGGGGGMLFTENNFNRYIEFSGSGGTYELRIKAGADANPAAIGQPFGKIVINPADFNKVENHAKTHTQGLQSPSQNLAPYLLTHFNTESQDFEPPVFVVAPNSADDYRTMYSNFQKMLIKTTPPKQIEYIIGAARFQPVQMKFNYNSPLQQVLENESYTTRQQGGLRPAQGKVAKKKKKSKKKK